MMMMTVLSWINLNDGTKKRIKLKGEKNLR